MNNNSNTFMNGETQNNHNNQPIRPQSPLQNNLQYIPTNSFVSQNILESPIKQNSYNLNYSNQRFSKPAYITASPSLYTPRYSTTRNPNSLEAIKNYFVNTFLSQPDRLETSRVQDIPLTLSNNSYRIK